MKRKPPDDTPERNDTDSEEVARRIAESERKRKYDRNENDVTPTLKYYADQYCEGWCKDSLPNAFFNDCGGCRARLVLANCPLPVGWGGHLPGKIEP